MKPTPFSGPLQSGNPFFARLRAFPNYPFPGRRPVLRRRSRNYVRSPWTKALDRFSLPLEVALNLIGFALLISQAVSYFHHGRLAQIGLPQWGHSSHLLIWLPTAIGLLLLAAAEGLLLRRLHKTHSAHLHAHSPRHSSEPHRLAWAFHQD